MGTRRGKKSSLLGPFDRARSFCSFLLPSHSRRTGLLSIAAVSDNAVEFAFERIKRAWEESCRMDQIEPRLIARAAEASKVVSERYHDCANNDRG